MSRQALGKRKRYILGFGVGPKPSSSSSTPSRMSQDHVGKLQKLKAEMEEMKMEREELRRQLEQERRECEEEKKEREEEQKQITHLTSLVTKFLKERLKHTSHLSIMMGPCIQLVVQILVDTWWSYEHACEI
ncbi:capping protein inhibiting regulator of actin dynamics-like [Phoenix dactylifera]|uniref:Capping protein inhibiting regulator of actin dynamics-like n=1 Tax=Phoenix dactylifera TaxID=42345 RepID=A0A8B8ZGP8_PHODC|nr:capping protein inhibiting regulator of actin dynamics-like [Phoenix dactylifera]